MADYRSQTQVDINGEPKEIGHMIGLAAVIARLVEFIADGEKDKVKLLAAHLMDLALADIDDHQTNKDTDSDKEETIKLEAKAAIRQVLLPLPTIESVQ